MRTTRRPRPSQRRDAAEPLTGALVYLAARDALQARLGLLLLAPRTQDAPAPAGPAPRWTELAADPLLRRLLGSGHLQAVAQTANAPALPADALRELAAANERLRLAEQLTGLRVQALERRARLLSAANELLEVLPEALAERASDVLSRLGCLLVPALADFVRIDVLREDGTLEAGAVVHAGPDGWHPDGATELAERVAGGGAAVVLLNGETLPQGFRSLASLPLRARGRTLGVLTLGMAAGARALDDEDVRLAEDVARATAVALDNARLFVQARGREQALAAVSHELRSPLQVISIASGALLRAWPADAALVPYRRQVAVIAESADRMLRLAADLLDLSRVDAGHFSVQPEPVRVGVLLHSVLEVYRPLAEQKDIRLAVGTFPTCAAMLDEERVHQVFANLIGNAVRYTPPGGTITLSAAVDGDAVQFSVSDTGAGIDPQNLPRVFERFWSGGRCRGCAGLGLAISRAIVDAHGGTIRADSRPGQGATFTFTLPLADA